MARINSILIFDKKEKIGVIKTKLSWVLNDE